MKRRSWFTLLELLIVMVILSVLFVLLLKTYNRISTVVFRVQQEKEVTQEVLQISQIVQNFSERNTIDYYAYNDQLLMTNYQWTGLLAYNQWITDVLYLSGQDGNLAFFSSWDCKDPAQNFFSSGTANSCSLYMNIHGATVELTNSKKIALSRVIFKVVPFASQQQYLDYTWLCVEGDYLHCMNTPWFRVIFTAYSVNYWSQWARRVAIPFQQFF